MRSHVNKVAEVTEKRVTQASATRANALREKYRIQETKGWKAQKPAPYLRNLAYS